MQSKFLAVGLGRAVGRAVRRRDRDAVVGQPALRAGRARTPPRRDHCRGGRRPADRCGRRAGRSASSGSSTARDALRPTRKPMQRRGPGHRTGAGLRSAGKHPGLGETVDALADDVRGLGRRAAHRTAPRLPRRGAGSGRRPARTAVGGSSRRRPRAGVRAGSRTFSSTSASTTISGRSRSCAACTSSTRSSSAARRDRSGSRSTTRCGGRSRTASRSSATTVSQTGRASRTSRNASTGRTPSTRSSSGDSVSDRASPSRSQLGAEARGLNSSHVSELRITPRTNLQPPSPNREEHELAVIAAVLGCRRRPVVGFLLGETPDPSHPTSFEPP